MWETSTPHKRKQLEALEYYKKNGVLQKLESILNEMFLHQPNDVHSYIVIKLIINSCLTRLRN